MGDEAKTKLRLSCLVSSLASSTPCRHIANLFSSGVGLLSSLHIAVAITSRALVRPRHRGSGLTTEEGQAMHACWLICGAVLLRISVLKSAPLTSSVRCHELHNSSRLGLVSSVDQDKSAEKCALARSIAVVIMNESLCTYAIVTFARCQLRFAFGVCAWFQTCCFGLRGCSSVAILLVQYCVCTVCAEPLV